MKKYRLLTFFLLLFLDIMSSHYHGNDYSNSSSVQAKKSGKKTGSMSKSMTYPVPYPLMMPPPSPKKKRSKKRTKRTYQTPMVVVAEPAYEPEPECGCGSKCCCGGDLGNLGMMTQFMTMMMTTVAPTTTTTAAAATRRRRFGGRFGGIFRDYLGEYKWTIDTFLRFFIINLIDSF